MSSSRNAVRCPNLHLQDLTDDVLYHLNLGTGTHNLPEMFSEIKFVVVGGTASRMLKFATEACKVLAPLLAEGYSPANLTGSMDRYVMYKVGPVLAVSHGVGVPSMSIMLHEVFKLLLHAGCSDVVFIRAGTSGGIGVEPGTVVVTNEAFSAELKPEYELAVLGKRVTWPAILDQPLVNDLVACNVEEDSFTVIKGGTMTAMDFYEGQARLDGALCEYKEEDKMAFLQRLHVAGVRNIEMEAAGFAALTHRVGVKGAIVCVALLDRLHGDQVATPKDTLKQWETRPLLIILRYIAAKLKLEGKSD